MGFDPCERAEHYVGRQQPGRFDVQAEQRHASERGTIPTSSPPRSNRLDRADLLILQYPMWWHLPPAMLKGWLDRVLIYRRGVCEPETLREGPLRGQARHAVGDGRHQRGHLCLRRQKRRHRPPAMAGQFLARLCRLCRVVSVHRVRRRGRPQIFGCVRRGGAAEDGWRRTSGRRSRDIDRRAVIPFNRMAEWGANGRITAEATIHSPFVRRKQHLDLE